MASSGSKTRQRMDQIWEVFLERILRRYFGLSVYARIPSSSSVVLTGLIVAVIVGSYLAVSSIRHEANPSDKLVPTIGQLIDGIRYSITPDRNENIPLLADTIASLRRFFLGMVIGSAGGILIGLHMGLFPFLEALLFRFVQFFGKIPPIVLMPIVFIAFGTGEFAKVLMIIVGTCPAILLAAYFRTKAIPRQQLTKALTLGGSTSEVVTIALTQIMPDSLKAVRINLLTAWLFLLTTELVDANAGLGYRIFLVRRYLAMDIIIPYALWIAFLSFVFDTALGWYAKYKFRWHQG